MNETVASVAPASWRGDRGFWLLFLVAALLGLIYNFVILIGYAPDEPRHMAYLKLLLDERRLPFLLPNGGEYAGAHTLHPPLYYLSLLPLYALSRALPGDWAWHVVRLGSLAMCLAALPLIYQIASRASASKEATECRNIARLATAHVALLPMWGMTAASINNDAGTLLLVTLFLWLLGTKYFDRRDVRSAAWLGVCLGAAGLCKLNALLCGVAALIFYFLAQDGARAFLNPRVWLRGAVVLGVAGSFLAPWFARNMSIYGQLAPIPPAMPNPTGGDWHQIFHPDFPGYFGQANWGMLATMWSQKDWIPETIRPTINTVLAIYVALALTGLVLRRRHATVVNPRPKVLSPTESVSEVKATAELSTPTELSARVAHWSGFAAFGANWLAVLQGALFLTWGWAEGGRYLLPSLAGIAIALALGWREVLGTNRLRALSIGWSVAMVALNVLCLYWLLSYLNPTFGPKH